MLCCVIPTAMLLEFSSEVCLKPTWSMFNSAWSQLECCLKSTWRNGSSQRTLGCNSGLVYIDCKSSFATPSEDRWCKFRERFRALAQVINYKWRKNTPWAPVEQKIRLSWLFIFFMGFHETLSIGRYIIYSVFHSIWTQEWGYCELHLGLLRSQRASMWSEDWAQITFRSETHRNKFYSVPRRRL